MVNFKNITGVVMLTSVISYGIIFLILFMDNFNNVIETIAKSNVSYVALAYLTRVASLTLHALTFWVLLKMFESRISVLDTLKVTYVSIFLELLVPIGGITEVGKYYLLTKYRSVSPNQAIASITLHRVILSMTLFVFLMIAVRNLRFSTAYVMLLYIPALGLILINLTLLLIPSSKRLEDLVNKVLTKLKMEKVTLTESYVKTLTHIGIKPQYVVLAALVALAERYVNALHGIMLAYLIGININFWQAIIGFDSIYTIIWLYPIVTPGNVGIYELTQTGVLTLAGLSRSYSALLSVFTRVFLVIAEYPLFFLSALLIGVDMKSLVKDVREMEAR